MISLVTTAAGWVLGGLFSAWADRQERDDPGPRWSDYVVIGVVVVAVALVALTYSGFFSKGHVLYRVVDGTITTADRYLKTIAGTLERVVEKVVPW